jgi:hypothetical protein
MDSARSRFYFSPKTAASVATCAECKTIAPIKEPFFQDEWLSGELSWLTSLFPVIAM